MMNVCLCRFALTPDRTVLDPQQEVPLADWELFVRDTAVKVLEEQSPQRSVVLFMCDEIV
jgi:hypothetical protein